MVGADGASAVEGSGRQGIVGDPVDLAREAWNSASAAGGSNRGSSAAHGRLDAANVVAYAF